MDFLPRHEFNQCVRRYQGNYRVRKFSCLDQFPCMVFAQLTYRESLRDTETCLRAVQSKLYHVGIRGRVSRSTLADANESRDWRIWADFAQVLVGRARRLYAGEDFGLALQQSAYALDSTTIDLCLSLFPWARFRRRKGAIKVHTLMDLRGSIPCFIRITAANVHDVNILDELLFQPGAFYVMDRAYTDFARLYAFTRSSAFFVVRAKRNLHYGRLAYRHVDKSTGLPSDQRILLQGPKTSQAYPDTLRRISYVDRIKAFLGTSQNAVKTQIWIAISVYLLVAILKKELKLERSLGEILQILSITLFEKVSMNQVLRRFPLQQEESTSCKQLILFEF